MLEISISKKFLRVAIVCCFFSAITTIGIHSNLFDLTNVDSLRVFENSTYMAKRFWVIAHCLFVFISMLGFLLIQIKKETGFTVLGFIFYLIFSIAEIYRQLFYLFYINNLRRSYFEAGDSSLQELIQMNIEQAGFVGYSLFALFIFAFAIGIVMV